jgi:hypothetical protein
MKSCIQIGTLLAALFFASASFAANRNWSAGANTPDWFTPANWGGAVPTIGDSPRLGVVNPPSPALWPEYNGDNSTTPTTGAFTISQVMDAYFTMSGGTFIHSNNVNLGNGAGFSGSWTHNGGNFIAASNTFAIAPAASSAGSLTMNGGSITVKTLNLGQGASATGNLTINTGLFFAYGYANLNNSSKTGSGANLFIGNGGTLDVDRAEFYKSATTIGPGGLFRVRNELNAATPVSIRSLNTVDLAGGEFDIHADYTGIVPGWVTDGKLITSLPGASVSFNYDADTGYTRIFALVPEPTCLSLLVIGLGLLGIRRR